MSDKRYTVIFDAKDKISSVLDRFIRKSKESEDALKRTSRETEKFGQSATDHVKKVDGAYENLHGRLRIVDGAFLKMDDHARRSSFALRDMGGTPLSRLSDGLGGIVGVLGSVSTAAVGAGAAISAMAAKGTFDHVLMPAMQREADTVTIGATLKDKTMLPDLMKDIEGQSRESVFGMSDILKGTKGMLGLTQDRELLGKVNNLTERIALTDPEQGYSGAAYSMKQVMSGDLNSLIDRFELDRASFYKEGYQSGLSPEQYYSIVDKVISDKGFDQGFLKESRGTGMAQYENAKSNIQELGVKSGAGMVDIIKPQLESINALFKDDAGMKEFTDSMSSRFKNLTSDVFDLGDGVDLTWKDITAWSNETFDGVEKILKSTGKTFKTTLALLAGDDLSKPKDAFKNFGDALDNVASFIDKINSGIKAFGDAMDYLKPLNDWWKDTKDSGLATALGLNADKKDKSSNEEYGMFMGPAHDMMNAWGDIDWGNLKPDWNPFANFSDNISKEDNVPLFGDNLFGRGIEDGANWMTGWFGGQADGSHANGLSYVPKDDYKANLHKGERVLTRAENRDYSQLIQSNGNNEKASVIITGNQFHVRNESDIDAIGESIVMRLQSR